MYYEHYVAAGPKVQLIYYAPSGRRIYVHFYNEAACFTNNGVNIQQEEEN